MSLTRPKPEDDLERLQAEFLQSQSRPSASFIRTSKNLDSHTPQINERVILDAVDEEEEEEEESVEDDEDAANRLDEHDSRTLPAVVARVIDREINSTVLPLISAYPTSGFPASPFVASSGSSEGKKSLFAQNLLRKKQLAGVPNVPLTASDSAKLSENRSLASQSAQSISETLRLARQVSFSTLKSSSSSGVTSLSATPAAELLKPSHALSALSLADQKAIQAGNDKALAGMSEDEVLEAQREIESLLSPDLVAMIRRRSAVPALAPQTIAEVVRPEPESFKGETIDGENQKPEKNEQTLSDLYDANKSPADMLQNFLDSKKPPEEGMTEQEWEELGEQKQEWMKPLSEEECMHKDSGWEHWRVDFEGVPVHGKSIPLHKGLHHHGDEPGVAGYNLTELIRLCRSTVPAQRAVAMNVLTHILERARQGLYVEKRPEDPDSLIRQVILAGFSPELSTQSGGGPINYSQALVTHLLQLNFTVIVRCGIDDSNITAQRAALEALRALLYVKRTGNDRAWELTRGYEHSFSADLDKEVDLAAINLDNLLTGLLQTQLLTRFRFILECVNELSLHSCVVDCLLIMARHSPQACELIFLTPRMALVLSKLIMNVIASRGGTTVAGPHRAMLFGEGLLTLLCLLCASSVKICTHFVNSGLMLQLKRLIVVSIGLPGAVLSFPSDLSAADIILSVCALRCWRVSLCFHLETSLFLDTFPVLCKAVTLQIPRDHPHFKLLRLQSRAIYNIFDLACVLAGSVRIEKEKSTRGTAEESDGGGMGGDIGWTQVTITVEHALSVASSFLERDQMIEEDFLVLGGVLRLLGTYFMLLPFQPEFIVAHTKKQAKQLLQRWFMSPLPAIKRFQDELVASLSINSSSSLASRSTSDSVSFSESSGVNCLHCSSTCTQTSVITDAKMDVLYNFYRFLHSLLLLPELGPWSDSDVSLSTLVDQLAKSNQQFTRVEALFVHEICCVSELVGLSSFALRLRVFPFLISQGNIHLANQILNSLTDLGPYKGETLVCPANMKQDSFEKSLLLDESKRTSNTPKETKQQGVTSKTTWQQSSKVVLGWLSAAFHQADLVHAQQLHELDGLTSLFIREPLTAFKNNEFYLFWPFSNLLAIEDTQQKIEHVNQYLQFLSGLPSTNVWSSSLWKTALLRALMRIYEMGSEVFLAVRTYHVPLLQSLLHLPPASLSASTASTMSLTPLYDFDALPDARFYPVFENLVSVYSQDSWGDPMFGECILLLLGMSYAPAYRQLVWSELQAVFRVLPPTPPLHETYYFYPIETNIKVLKLYEESLFSRQKLPIFFEQIALHHFSSALRNSSQKAMDRFRSDAPPDVWEAVNSFRTSSLSTSSLSTSSSSTSAANTDFHVSSLCVCCSRYIVWQDEGVWSCWFCASANSSRWKCSKC